MKRTMPKKKLNPRRHKVKAAVSNIDLTKNGTAITLEVYAAAERIGTVGLGRGTISWRGGRKRKETIVDWTRFAEWMESEQRSRAA